MRARLIALILLVVAAMVAWTTIAEAQPGAPQTAAPKKRKPKKKKAPKPVETPPASTDAPVPAENPAPTPPVEAPTTPAADPTPPATSSPSPTPEPTPAPAPSAGEEEPTPGLGPVGGKVFAYGRAAYDAPYQQVSSSVWLRAQPRFGASTYAKIVLTGDVVDGTASQEALRGRVREAYVGYRKGGFDLRIGQQVIPWGSADFVNPTDLLGARDYTFFSADPEVSRIGAVSALAAYTIPGTDLQLTLVATPLFPRSKLLVPAASIPNGVVIAEEQRLEPRLDRTEVAGKIKYSGAGWDIAAVGFHGYAHLPQLALQSIGPGGIVVAPRFHRQSALGIDGSATLGAWVLRLEGAYVRTGDPYEKEPFTMPSHLAGVFGLEHGFSEHLRVSGQMSVRYFLPGYQSPRDTRPAADFPTQVANVVRAVDARLFDFQDQVRPMAIARFAAGNEEDVVQAELVGAFNLVGGDFVVRPVLGIKPSDAFLLQIGYEQAVGRSSTPFGTFRPYSGAFAQATFSF